MNALFGTDGIRCQFGTYPLTFEGIYHFGYAFAQWALSYYGKNATILIAHDTRISGNYIKALLKASLLEHELILFDAHVLPTPVAATAILAQKLYDCCIIITASHNPAQDNGIKIIDQRTGKLLPNAEKFISDYLAQQKPTYTYNPIGTEYNAPTLTQNYQQYLQNFFPKNFLQSITIVLDCANGATYSSAPTIFEHFGATVTRLHAQPNGTNINYQCGSLAPVSLQEAVTRTKAHIGFAFDGDGDRVLAVNRHGTIKDGDDILALLSMHPAYHKTETIIGTVMANQGLAQFLATHNKTLLRTPVGDKYVAAQLRQSQSLLGGEQSGHIILADHIFSGDGIFTALRLLEVVIAHQNWDLVTFKHFPQYAINIPVTTKKPLTLEPYATLIQKSQNLLKTGRLLVRYSGTENYLRIMAEDEDENNLTTIVHTLKNSLLKELNS